MWRRPPDLLVEVCFLLNYGHHLLALLMELKLGTQILDGYLKRQRDVNANGARGVVTYYHRFDLQVRTGSNSYRAIHLHQGTVINPRGISLTNGMNVDVSGQAQSDGSLNADQITVQQ